MLNALAHLKPYCSRCCSRVGLAAIATATALLPGGAIAGELNIRLSSPSQTTSRSQIQIYDASGGSVRTFGSVSSYSRGRSGGSSIQLRIGDGQFDSFDPDHAEPFGAFGSSHRGGRRHGQLRPRVYRSPQVRIRKRVDDQFDAQGFRVYDRDDRDYTDRRSLRDYNVRHFRPRTRRYSLPLPH